MPKHQEYSKEYRNQIGFTSQETAKEFLAGKDVEPQIDFGYIELLNERISCVIRNLNDVITNEAKRRDLDIFLEKHLVAPYSKLKNNNIISRLNNQGRRSEEVLFSWLRGYVASEFFCLAISKIFEIKLESILHIGEDDLNNIEIFKRGPRADLEIQRGSQKIRLEVQSGFQGVNDIKEHKIIEAHRVYAEGKTITVAIHFDFFNGQAAFVQLDRVPLENNPHFVQRAQMEGQRVLQIDARYFKWRFLNPLPLFSDLELKI